jgi:hypothetical protein
MKVFVIAFSLFSENFCENEQILTFSLVYFKNSKLVAICGINGAFLEKFWMT